MSHVLSVTTSGLTYSGGTFYINVYVDGPAYNITAYARSGSWYSIDSTKPEYHSDAKSYQYTCTATPSSGGDRHGEVIFTYYTSASDSTGEDYSFTFYQPGYITGIRWSFTVANKVLSQAGSSTRWEVYATVEHADGSESPIDSAFLTVSSQATWLTVETLGVSVTPPYYVFGTAQAAASDVARYGLLQASYQDYTSTIVLYQEGYAYDIDAVQGWLRLGAATITKVDVYENTTVETPVSASDTPVFVSLGFYSNSSAVRSVGGFSTTISSLLSGGLVLGPTALGDGIPSLGAVVSRSVSASTLFVGLGSSAEESSSELSLNVQGSVNAVVSDVSIEGNTRHLKDFTGVIQSTGDPVSFTAGGGTVVVTYTGIGDILYTSETEQREYLPLQVSSDDWVNVSDVIVGGSGPASGSAPARNRATFAVSHNTGDARDISVVPVTAYTDGSVNVPFIVGESIGEVQLRVTQAASSPDFEYSNLTCIGTYPAVQAVGGLAALSLIVEVLRTIQGSSPSTIRLSEGEYSVTGIAFTSGGPYSYVTLSEDTGALTWQANSGTAERSVSVSVSIAAFGLTTTATCVCTQAGSALEYTYYPPVLSFSYPSVDAAGGTAVPVLTATQRRTGNDGSDVQLSLNFADSDFTDVVFSAGSVSGASLNTTSGVVTWAKNTSTSTRSVEVSVSLKANGIQGSASAVSDQAAASLVYTYDPPVFTLQYPSKDASAGSVSPTLSATQVRRGNDDSEVTLQLQLSQLSGVQYTVTQGTGATVNSDSGVLSWSAYTSTSSDRTVTVSISATANGVSGSGVGTATQTKDTVVSCTPWAVTLSLGSATVDSGSHYVSYSTSASRSCTYVSGQVLQESGTPTVSSGASWAQVDVSNSRIIVSENTVASERYTIITATYESVSDSATLTQQRLPFNVNVSTENGLSQTAYATCTGELSVPALYDAKGTYNTSHIIINPSGSHYVSDAGYLNPREETLSFNSISISSLCQVFSEGGSPLQGSYSLWIVVYSSISGQTKEIARTGDAYSGVVHTIGQQAQDTLTLDNTIQMDSTIRFDINFKFLEP